MKKASSTTMHSWNCNSITMVWFWEICILGLAFSSALSLKSIQMDDKTAKCLSYIVRNEHSNFTQNIRINIETESKQTKLKFGQTIDQFLASNDEILVDLDSNENLHYTIHWRFLFVDSFDSFRFLLERQRENDPDTTGINQYYIVILPVNMEDLNDIMDEIIKFCWNHFIQNINILIEDPNGIVTVHTYYPFTRSSCKNSQSTILSRCENGSLDSSQSLYPAKFNNFWKCPVTAILWHQPPYVSIDQARISGMDWQILKTLAKCMNFSLKHVISPNEMGNIYSNGTATGSFKLLFEKLGDLMMEDASCSRLRKAKLASASYYLSPIIAIIKRPRPYGSLKILILPFDWYTWLLILILFLGKFIFQVIWSKFFSNVVPFTVNSSRLCILSWLFGIFIFTSSYEGSIFNFLHNRPRNAVPNNIEDAVRDGYKLICDDNFNTLLNEIPELKDHLIMLDKSLSDIFKEFEILGDKFAVIAKESEYLTLRESDSFQRRKYISLKKPVCFDLSCIYMPKYSFLTEVFEKWLPFLLENGYIHQMYKQFVRPNNMNYNEINESREPMSISLQHSMGAFQLLGVMLGISMFVFLLELLSERYQRLRLLIVSLNG